MKRLLFDLEGNGLLPELTKLHCIAATDVDTGEAVGAWGPNEIPQALDVLAQADKLIAHYGLGYDFPALEKVHNFRVPEERQVDTVIVARLKVPHVKELDAKFNLTCTRAGLPLMGEEFGRHTIAAWGIRLGIPKLFKDIEDWSEWTPQMQERCVGDVRTCLRLWKYLKPDEMSQPAIELEHRIQRLCIKITEAGWPFDVTKAGALHATLIEERDKVFKELKAQFGTWTVDHWFTPKVNNKARGYVKGVPINKIETVEFNPNSRQHIERCLRLLGWEPQEKTESGQAKLDEEVLEGIAAEYEQAKGLTRFMMLTKRIGQLATGKQAWLGHVKADGRIHGEYNPMGAVTSRASHFNPNIAQVPAAASEYGHECRELFYVPKDWGVQLGADMSGLEGRCFAHYLAKYDEGRYGKALLEGDPHWAVVVSVGFAEGERDKSNQLHTIVRETGAKRLFYAMLYGAGDEKAGRIILDACRLARKTNPEWGGLYTKFFGDDEAPGPKLLKRVGSKAKFDVIQGIEGFDKLKRTLSDICALCDYKEHKWVTLPGLDGRRLPVRSEHSALNTLLQSAGAILCKQWACDAYDALIASGLKWGWDGDFVFLGWIHDEVQVACRNGLGDRIGEVLTAAARQAGTPFKFRIALDSSYTIGNSWKDTH